MAGVHAGRWVSCALALILLLAANPRQAGAVEAFDGRIQLHGFYEMQVRGLNRDFAEEFDLSQWYHVVNLELEVDILPDGWGPFDLLQAYVRGEGRFDCIYVDGCWMFPAVSTYGNQSQDLPLRLRDAEADSYSGAINSNAFDDPPGRIAPVPPDGQYGKDPVPWSLLAIVQTPLADKNNSGVPAVSSPEWIADPEKDPSNRDFYDPDLDDYLTRIVPGQMPNYGLQPGDIITGPTVPRDLTPCQVNGIPNALDPRITCIDNRPEKNEVVKRRAFPGFDTLFDVAGADAEIGPNPDYATALNPPIQALLDNPPLNTQANLPNPGDVPPDGRFGGLDIDAATPTNYWEPDTTIEEIGQIAGTVQTFLDAATPPLSGTREPQKNLGVSELDSVRDAFYAPHFRGLAQLDDTPGAYTLDAVSDWKFTFRSISGPDGGFGQALPMGPWLPKNFFDTKATLSDRANALRGRRTPTFIFREAIPDPLGMGLDQAGQQIGGFRYHDLDNGTLDEAGNLVDCSVVQCDPVDPRLYKLQALTQSLIDAGINDPLTGLPQPTNNQFGTPRFLDVGLYPNNPFLQGTRGQRFGGDFSGIVPCKVTENSLRDVSQTNFDQQLRGRRWFSGCIPYTNIQAVGGEGELPLRPAPSLSNLSVPNLQNAQGLYIPSAGYLRSLQELEYNSHNFNFDQTDRSFNRGDSQRQTYELKEAYLDAEFFDSRLWVRAGLQNIVWGKTELFRTTDQFNPQDFALASLPSLEESRIALLSARAVWSFYDVGPLEDVRFEIAANFDRIQPADLGTCGEPYTIDQVCGLTLGLAIHGITGIGVAGIDRPPSGWEDIDGVEFGGRIEFRWDRFSFAITDFYGYNDFPYADPIFFFDRTVDLDSGRMLKAFATGGCQNGAGILVQDPFHTGDPNEILILHPGNPGQYDPTLSDAERAALRTTGERDVSGEFATVTEWQQYGANDDYARRKEAYTILGVGIDSGCLKPGGLAGGPNANLFDPTRPSVEDFALIDYSDPNTDAPLSGTFITSTRGQWQFDPMTEEECAAAGLTYPCNATDDALSNHPANQQLFNWICTGTVGIVVAIAPGACAWNLFTTSAGFLAGESGPALTERISAFLAGEPDVPQLQGSFIQGIINNTKGSPLPGEGTMALVPLNSDIRDGRTNGNFQNESNFARAWFRSTAIDCFNPPSQLSYIFNCQVDQRRGIWVEQDCPGGVCKVDQARDPYDWLTIDNTMTPEQKALLGCGPYFGTRCDNGERVFAVRYLSDSTSKGFRAGDTDILGEQDALKPSDDIELIYVDQMNDPNPETCVAPDLDKCMVYGPGGGLDFLNMEASVLLQSLPGIEGTTDGWTTWSREPQPGTIGTPGQRNQAGVLTRDPNPFVGGEYCARYDPSHPLANDLGLVRLPGCRGAVSAVVNDQLKTIDVVFEPGYTPRVDGCVFQRVMRLNGPKSGIPNNTPYYTRAVVDNTVAAADIQLDVDLQNELADTCFNGGGYADIRGNIAKPILPGYNGGSVGDERVTNDHQFDPTFFSYTRRDINCRDFPSCQLDARQLVLFDLDFDAVDPLFQSRGVPTGTFVVRPQNTFGKNFLPDTLIGAGTLFHPFANCQDSSQRNNISSTKPPFQGLDISWDPNNPNGSPSAGGDACFFQARDYQNDFLRSNAQVFRNELAAFSFNFMMFLTISSCNSVSGTDDLNDPDCFDSRRPWNVQRCSFSQPQLCRNVKAFLGVGGLGRNDVRAGGNPQYGRREFIWDSGGEVAIRYARRNVFGFSADFAEDHTKTNWGMEFTYIGKVPYFDNNSLAVNSNSDAFNLTVSVDRPTFINFLNANRTFFFNSQWFFQYLPGWEKGFLSPGPFNVLFTFAVFTGYYQDRLLPQFVSVYDFRTKSGGFLPQLSYRFTESFSMTFGVSFFIGSDKFVDMPVNGIGPNINRAGGRAYLDGTEQLLSLIRNRDEAFLRLRWTF